MTLGGYLSGRRMARDTAKISRHNQCGGPKKAGLAPQGAWMRQGMGNLRIIKSCDSRAANTNSIFLCHILCGMYAVCPLLF